MTLPVSAKKQNCFGRRLLRIGYGRDAGHAVFFSVSDGTKTASVYYGTGASVDEAWENSVSNAEEALKKSGTEPEWVKTDVVYIAGKISAEELKESLLYSEVGFLSYGAAFDPEFQTALLEQELNAAFVYDYENGGIDLDALNTYLKKSKRESVKDLPDDYILFRCAGWICDEKDAVYRLNASGLGYGQRIMEPVDDTAAAGLVSGAAEYLMRNISQKGEISGANTMQQAEVLHALLCACQLSPNAELKEKIPLVAKYLAENVSIWMCLKVRNIWSFAVTLAVGCFPHRSRKRTLTGAWRSMRCAGCTTLPERQHGLMGQCALQRVSRYRIICSVRISGRLSL